MICAAMSLAPPRSGKSVTRMLRKHWLMAWPRAESSSLMRGGKDMDL